MKKYIDITPKSNSKTNTQVLLTIPLRSETSCKEPNDGTFIEYDKNDSFNANGTVRYGEETDVDDI